MLSSLDKCCVKSDARRPPTRQPELGCGLEGLGLRCLYKSLGPSSHSLQSTIPKTSLRRMYHHTPSRKSSPWTLRTLLRRASLGSCFLSMEDYASNASEKSKGSYARFSDEDDVLMRDSDSCPWRPTSCPPNIGSAAVTLPSMY